MPLVVSQCTTATCVIPAKRQMPGDKFGSEFLVLRDLQHVQCDAVDARDLSDAPPVCAVDQHQQFAVPRNRGGDDRFDDKGAAALHEDAFILLAGIRTQASRRVRILRTVARNSLSSESEIAEHGPLDRGACGQGAGGKEQLIRSYQFAFSFSSCVAVAVVAIAVVERRLRNHCNRLRRRGVDLLAAQVSCFDDDILDGIRRNLAGNASQVLIHLPRKQLDAGRSLQARRRYE